MEFRDKLILRAEEIRAEVGSAYAPWYQALEELGSGEEWTGYPRAQRVWQGKLRRRAGIVVASAMWRALAYAKLTPDTLQLLAAEMALEEMNHRSITRKSGLAIRRKSRTRKKIEAKARLLREAVRNKRKYKERGMDHGVTIDDGDRARVDLTADVLWVYQNLNVLIVLNDDGVRMLSPAALKLAPSSGAVVMAEYARDNLGDFFSKFLMRILNKESGRPAADDQDDAAEAEKELDPDFGDLEGFFDKEEK